MTTIVGIANPDCLFPFGQFSIHDRMPDCMHRSFAMLRMTRLEGDRNHRPQHPATASSHKPAAGASFFSQNDHVFSPEEAGYALHEIR